MWIFGTVAYAVSLLIFGYFIATGYRIQRTQEFVSLSSSDGDCSEVEMNVEGTYLATQSGIWEGAPGFNYDDATYFLQLSNYKESEETFRNQMNYVVLPQLNAISSNATKRNAVENLMLWMTWTAKLRPHITGDLNFLSMTGAR